MAQSKTKNITDGILNVYKEKGFTSHDVVAKLRGILHIKKIGHTGTLDPDAEGVLPVCLGKGTRLCQLLTDKDKEYEALLKLGTETDTQDTSGQVLAEKPVRITPKQLEMLISGFVGEIEQVPPMYSAIKINGKKLYELARAGKEVERQARQIQIYGIDICQVELPFVRIRVRCSKGTYIRTLCHDIGRAAGCGGCMAELTRLRSGQFSKEDSLTLAQIETLVREGRLDEYILPVDAFFSTLPALTLSENMDKPAHNGNALSLTDHDVFVRQDTFKKYENKWEKPPETERESKQEELSVTNEESKQKGLTEIECGSKRRVPSETNGESIAPYGRQKFRVYDSSGCFIGVYEKDDEAPLLKPWKMFYGG